MVYWQQKLQSLWYRPKIVAYLWLLWPFAKLYLWGSHFRRWLYTHNILTRHKFSAPIVIVGNITVGGAGKTPAVIALVALLKKHGWNPGVVSRGYKGKHKQVTAVLATTAPQQVGDEPVLIAKRASCPVVIGKNRVAAVAYLLQNYPVNVIICDDGLQHYALQRDLEIVIIDGQRRYGNGCCLPMGPLRELPTRLQQANLLLVNGGSPLPGEFAMQIVADKVYNLQQPDNCCSLVSFATTKVHAVAGIGLPDKFFNCLQAQGLTIIPHPFADHYSFKEQDLNFADNYPVIMTEKDAVKCRYFATSNHWFLPIEAILPINFAEQFLQLLNKVKNGRSEL